MPPFQRKVLCLIGCAGVGRRTLKNRIIETYPDKFGTTLPRKYSITLFLGEASCLFSKHWSCMFAKYVVDESQDLVILKKNNCFGRRYACMLHKSLRLRFLALITLSIPYTQRKRYEVQRNQYQSKTGLLMRYEYQYLATGDALYKCVTCYTVLKLKYFHVVRSSYPLFCSCFHYCRSLVRLCELLALCGLLQLCGTLLSSSTFSVRRLCVKD